MIDAPQASESRRFKAKEEIEISVTRLASETVSPLERTKVAHAAIALATSSYIRDLIPRNEVQSFDNACNLVRIALAEIANEEAVGTKLSHACGSIYISSVNQ